MNTTTESKNKKKKVSFLLEAQVIPKVPPLSCMSVDERCTLWYQPSDIQRFREADRNLCMQLQVLHDHNASNLLDIIGKRVCFRGLETRLSRWRQRERTQTIRIIIEVQHMRHIETDHIAQISRHYTAVAKQTALATGIKDYYAVYHPSRVENMLDIPIDPFPCGILETVDSRVLSQ